MKKYLPLLFALSLMVVTQKSAHAQVSLVVSPPRYDENVDPGATIQKTIKVTNNSDTEIMIRAAVYDFIVEDSSGTPIQVREEVSGRYLASPWFTLDRTEFKLAPQATELIYAVISVPDDALPGGHYAGVYFAPTVTAVPTQTSGAGVTPQIASLFSFTVTGEINYDALIKEFGAKNQIYEYGPVEFRAVVENQSDTHISPQASITIKDMIGRELETITLDQVNIFPFKSRAYESVWDQVWGIGKYTAVLSVAYGSGMTAERTAYFWIMPWKLIAAIVIVLLVMVVTFISVRRHLKHRSDTRDTEIDQLKRRIVELENDKR